MSNKQEILNEIQANLDSGLLTEADICQFITTRPRQATTDQSSETSSKTAKISAVDVMFYVAGVVLFAAVMSSIIQSWNDGSAFVHIALSAGVGVILWSVAYYLLQSSELSDVRRGLVNALLLTGSLSVISGGYIITNTIIGGFDDVNFTAGAVLLAVLAGVHVGFDSLIKRKLILLMGVLLGVAAFPALLFGFLEEANSPMDVWSMVMVISAALLAYATRVVAKLYTDREKLHNSFDSIAAFLALASMYFSSFGDYGVLWLGALVAGVIGIFYLSIVSQNRHLLGNGSFFLVLAVITISFKYFIGYGVTASLVVATIGLLGSAAVASSINKQYFK